MRMGEWVVRLFQWNYDTPMSGSTTMYSVAPDGLLVITQTPATEFAVSVITEPYTARKYPDAKMARDVVSSLVDSRSDMMTEIEFSR